MDAKENFSVEFFTGKVGKRFEERLTFNQNMCSDSSIHSLHEEVKAFQS